MVCLQCPLCRSSIPPGLLAVNSELRDLVQLAAALRTVPAHDDWQTVTSTFVRFLGCTAQLSCPAWSDKRCVLQGKGEGQDSANPHLLPSAPPLPVDLSKWLVVLACCSQQGQMPRAVLSCRHSAGRRRRFDESGGAHVVARLPQQQLPALQRPLQAR